jgi:tetratricopeptide (TPR) repeat protein
MGRFPKKCFGRLLVPLSLLLACLPAAGQERTTAVAVPEVQWRTDYNAARREAQDKNRPLVVDFGTVDCFWCKRLDATTFRDPAIIRVMNERFIPLRIDADREPTLAQVLRIQSYPTVVIAGPDGKILITQEGYLEAGPFNDKLQRALAAITTPEGLTRDYQEAVKAIAASDYARAIALLRGLMEDGRDRPVQVKGKQLLQDLDQQAAGRLARAKKLQDQGQSTEAMDTLTELVRVFAGTQAAAEAGQLVTSVGGSPELKEQQRTRLARKLLAQAREDYRTQQYLCCMDRCELLVAGYGDLSEADEARTLISDIKSNPIWMQTACEGLTDRLGSLYIALAESWLKKGQPQQATQYLEKVIKLFPSTRNAEIAQVQLARLQGPQPTQQTNFKKP